MEADSIFKSIQNEQLSEVAFVQDYIQLHFDGPILTCFNWPKIKNQNGEFAKVSLGYMDELCYQIGKIVLKIDFSETQFLQINFKDDSSIFLSLDKNAYNGPEILMFSNGPGQAVAVI